MLSSVQNLYTYICNSIPYNISTKKKRNIWFLLKPYYYIF